MGGKLAKLLSFVRTTRNDAIVSDVKVDTGGGYNLTGEHFSAPGEDAHPLPDDYVVMMPVQATGRTVAVGYADPNNPQVAEPGEKRIYARDSSGAVIVELWLKADGSAVLANAIGSITLSPDGSIVSTNGIGTITLEAGGDVNINGAIIDTDGNISSPTSVSAPSIVADGKELTDHDHPITGGSSAPGPTGPNNA